MEVITDLDAGTYSVTEDTPPNWALTDATCDNGDTPDAIALENGEVVTCTFTNTADPGSITIRKTTDPSPGPRRARASGSAVTSLARSATDSNSPRVTFRPGTYSVTELVPTSWTLSSIACSDDDSSGDTATGTATIVVAAGEDVTCTFTNTADPGSITIRKTTDPSPDPTSTSFRFSGDVVGSIGNGQQLTSGDLPPGTYSVTELVPTSWTLSSIACSDDDSSGDTATGTATIVVAAGEDVTCTFTNVAGDVAMAVDKSASALIVSHQGEDVAFTFTVSNTGDVPFSIVSLKDDVFGALAGDADCKVGTVLQPGAVCDFQQTFLVKPSVTPDQDDPGPGHPGPRRYVRGVLHPREHTDRGSGQSDRLRDGHRAHRVLAHVGGTGDPGTQGDRDCRGHTRADRHHQADGHAGTDGCGRRLRWG